jgi:uncharacterized protein
MICGSLTNPLCASVVAMIAGDTPFPDKHSARFITLDALRGFAVMAILAVNILSFAMPDAAFLSPHFHVPSSAADEPLWLMSFILMDGKFRGLFTILFGASMMLVMDRAGASGQSPLRVHGRRMTWLAVIGLGHYLLLWHGDILLVYALMGLVLSGLHGASGRQLLRWGTALLLAGGIWLTWLSADRIPSFFTALGLGADGAGLAEAHRLHDLDIADAEASIGEDLALFGGGYAQIVAGRVDKLINTLLSLPIAAVETLPLMMIGAGLYRTGFLTGAWREERYRRCVALCLPLGLICTAVPAIYIVGTGFDPMIALSAHLGFTVLGKLTLILAYAAMMILWISRRRDQPLVHKFAAAGRMALSNYLATSVVMTSIFYGYGAGLYGEVPVLGLYGIAASGCAMMVIWSPWWMARFHYGPAEWLWRSLARGEVQIFRR